MRLSNGRKYEWFKSTLQNDKEDFLDKEDILKEDSSMNILTIKNITKSFGKLDVLDDISVNIKIGEKVAIIGPSGSGKSTFLRCLNCIEDLTSGQIIFDGVDIADMKVDINIHRQKMGMVFQHFNLFNNKTVIQNIVMAPNHIMISNNNKNKRFNFFLPITNLFRKEKLSKKEIFTFLGIGTLVAVGCYFFLKFVIGQTTALELAAVSLTLSIIGTVAVFSGIFYLANPAEYTDPLFNILSGGLLLGAIFMATDYVTSPMSKWGGVVFGVGIGVITMLIRYFGAYPEGVSFAILIMNSVVPLLNKWFHTKKYGR